MDKTFVIDIRNKRAKNLSKIKYVCGNTDYIVAFDLDEDWSGIEAKTARFRVSDGTVIDTPFKGSTCPFPKIMAAYRVDVGVFAGNLKTSTNAIVECERGALSNDGPPPDPEPDVYARIMELLNAGVSEEQITHAVEKYLEENPADATLSIAGRAADAKATGDAVRKLSEEIEELPQSTAYNKSNAQKSVTDDVVILSESGVENVVFPRNVKMTVHGRNRFDYTKAVWTMSSGYGAQFIRTKEYNGLKIVSTATDANMYNYAYNEFAAEFTGELYVSCEASCEGNIVDLGMIVLVNGVSQQLCSGRGLLYEAVSVNAGDTVRIGFYGHRGTYVGNTLYYKKIMVAYSNLYEYAAYVDDVSQGADTNVIKTVNLPASANMWTANTVLPSTNGMRFVSNDVLLIDMLNYPTSQNAVADVVVTGADLVSYNDTYNSIAGVAISTSGKVSVYTGDPSITTSASFAEWLANNPISIQYVSTEISDEKTALPMRAFKSGEILSFDSAQTVSYEYQNTAKDTTIVCFGDSITGMFGNKTDYPSMLARKTGANVINAGFAGCQWTDHSSVMHMPFCMNRLVDAIVSQDYSLQEASAKVNPASSEYSELYAEHLSNLKTVDFRKVDCVTMLFGTNDWGVNIPINSADDETTENKQRTNLEDAVNYCISQLLTAYPNLRIMVICPYWRAITKGKDSNVNPNGKGLYLYEYSDKIEEITKKQFNLPTANLYWNLGANVYTNRLYTYDGTHPTEMTKRIIVDVICNGLHLN